MELTPIMTTSKIFGIREIRAAAKAAEERIDVDDSSFHISNVDNECAISRRVCRASKNEGDVFLLHLLPPFPARASLVAKHEKRLVALEAFQVGRLELFTRKDSNPLLHHCATTAAATANVFRPKRGASPPKLLPTSLPYSLARSAKRHIRRC